jgi:hypothetical protein
MRVIERIDSRIKVLGEKFQLEFSNSECYIQALLLIILNLLNSPTADQGMA